MSKTDWYTVDGLEIPRTLVMQILDGDAGLD